MKFTFTNKSSNKLAGNLELPAEKPRAFALFAHCFTCSKDFIAAKNISKKLTDHSIAILRFDFTGLGSSEGDFSNSHFTSNIEDLQSAYDALKQAYQAPTILIGHSLGGAAVLKFASINPQVKAVVTIGAPSDVSHVKHLFSDRLEAIQSQGQAKVKIAGREFKISRDFIDDLKQASLLGHVAQMNAALLCLHSPSDDIVSVDHAAEIYKAAKHPKSFIALDGADHLLSQKEDAHYVADMIAAWARRYVNVAKKGNYAVEPKHVLVRERGSGNYTQEILTAEHHLLADEPESLGGENLGLNPYELLMASLGACTSITIRMYADRKKIALENVQVLLYHEKIHADDCMSCEQQTGKVDRISKKITLQGDLTQDQKQKLYEIADKCPVNKTMLSEISIVKVEES